MRVFSVRHSYSFLLYVILRSVLGVVGNTFLSGLVVWVGQVHVRVCGCLLL